MDSEPAPNHHWSNFPHFHLHSTVPLNLSGRKQDLDRRLSLSGAMAPSDHSVFSAVSRETALPEMRAGQDLALHQAQFVRTMLDADILDRLATSRESIDAVREAAQRMNEMSRAIDVAKQATAALRAIDEVLDRACHAGAAPAQSALRHRA